MDVIILRALRPFIDKGVGKPKVKASRSGDMTLEDIYFRCADHAAACSVRRKRLPVGRGAAAWLCGRFLLLAPLRTPMRCLVRPTCSMFILYPSFNLSSARLCHMFLAHHCSLNRCDKLENLIYETTGNDMAHQLHLHTIHVKKFQLIIPWGHFSTGFIEITLDHLSVLAGQAHHFCKCAVCSRTVRSNDVGLQRTSADTLRRDHPDVVRSVVISQEGEEDVAIDRLRWLKEKRIRQKIEEYTRKLKKHKPGERVEDRVEDRVEKDGSDSESESEVAEIFKAKGLAGKLADRMVHALLRNVLKFLRPRVKINNVHVRYENLNDPLARMALGVVLPLLTIETPTSGAHGANSKHLQEMHALDLRMNGLTAYLHTGPDARSAVSSEFDAATKDEAEHAPVPGLGWSRTSCPSLPPSTAPTRAITRALTHSRAASFSGSIPAGARIPGTPPRSFPHGRAASCSSCILGGGSTPGIPGTPQRSFPGTPPRSPMLSPTSSSCRSEPATVREMQRITLHEAHEALLGNVSSGALLGPLGFAGRAMVNVGIFLRNKGNTYKEAQKWPLVTAEMNLFSINVRFTDAQANAALCFVSRLANMRMRTLYKMYQPLQHQIAMNSSGIESRQNKLALWKTAIRVIRHSLRTTKWLDPKACDLFDAIAYKLKYQKIFTRVLHAASNPDAIDSVAMAIKELPMTDLCVLYEIEAATPSTLIARWRLHTKLRFDEERRGAFGRGASGTTVAGLQRKSSGARRTALFGGFMPTTVDTLAPLAAEARNIQAQLNSEWMSFADEKEPGPPPGWTAPPRFNLGTVEVTLGSFELRLLRSRRSSGELAWAIIDADQEPRTFDPTVLLLRCTRITSRTRLVHGEGALVHTTVGSIELRNGPQGEPRVGAASIMQRFLSIHGDVSPPADELLGGAMPDVEGSHRRAKKSKGHAQQPQKHSDLNENWIDKMGRQAQLLFTPETKPGSEIRRGAVSERQAFRDHEALARARASFAAGDERTAPNEGRPIRASIARDGQAIASPSTSVPIESQRGAVQERASRAAHRAADGASGEDAVVSGPILLESGPAVHSVIRLPNILRGRGTLEIEVNVRHGQLVGSAQLWEQLGTFFSSLKEAYECLPRRFQMSHLRRAQLLRSISKKLRQPWWLVEEFLTAVFLSSSHLLSMHTWFGCRPKLDFALNLVGGFELILCDAVRDHDPAFLKFTVPPFRMLRGGGDAESAHWVKLAFEDELMIQTSSITDIYHRVLRAGAGASDHGDPQELVTRLMQERAQSDSVIKRLQLELYGQNLKLVELRAAAAAETAFAMRDTYYEQLRVHRKGLVDAQTQTLQEGTAESLFGLDIRELKNNFLSTVSETFSAAGQAVSRIRGSHDGRRSATPRQSRNADASGGCGIWCCGHSSSKEDEWSPSQRRSVPRVEKSPSVPPQRTMTRMAPLALETRLAPIDIELDGRANEPTPGAFEAIILPAAIAETTEATEPISPYSKV